MTDRKDDGDNKGGKARLGDPSGNRERRANPVTGSQDGTDSGDVSRDGEHVADKDEVVESGNAGGDMKSVHRDEVNHASNNPGKVGRDKTDTANGSRAASNDRISLNESAGAQAGAIGPKAPLVPSRARLSLFLMLGVYPLINVLLYLVLPLTPGWQMWQVTLIVVPLMVPMMVFGVMPLVQRLFGRFILVPKR